MKFFKPKTEKSRPVAVLDIDNTLIMQSQFIGEGQSESPLYLNEGLVNSLLAHGIKDVYLFSNMQLEELMMKASDNNLFARPDLVNLLKEKGFTVHAVISPADSAYGKNLGAAYTDFYLPQYKRVIKGELTKDNFRTDQSYQSAEKEVSKLTNQAARVGNYQTEKGMMYHYFLDKCPDWVESVVYCDDDAINLKAVHHANNDYAIQFKKEIPLTTIHVDKKDQEYFSNQPQKLERKIRLHIQLKLIHEIDDLIKDLNDKQLSDPTDIRKNKIKFLQELNEAIRTLDGNALNNKLNELTSKPEYEKALSGVITHKVKDIFMDVKKNLIAETISTKLNSPRKSND